MLLPALPNATRFPSPGSFRLGQGKAKQAPQGKSEFGGMLDEESAAHRGPDDHSDSRMAKTSRVPRSSVLNGSAARMPHDNAKRQSGSRFESKTWKPIEEPHSTSPATAQESAMDPNSTATAAGRAIARSNGAAKSSTPTTGKQESGERTNQSGEDTLALEDGATNSPADSTPLPLAVVKTPISTDVAEQLAPEDHTTDGGISSSPSTLPPGEAGSDSTPSASSFNKPAPSGIVRDDANTGAGIVDAAGGNQTASPSILADCSDGAGMRPTAGTESPAAAPGGTLSSSPSTPDRLTKTRETASGMFDTIFGRQGGEQTKSGTVESVSVSSPSAGAMDILPQTQQSFSTNTQEAVTLRPADAGSKLKPDHVVPSQLANSLPEHLAPDVLNVERRIPDEPSQASEGFDVQISAIGAKAAHAIGSPAAPTDPTIKLPSTENMGLKVTAQPDQQNNSPLSATGANDNDKHGGSGRNGLGGESDTGRRESSQRGNDLEKAQPAREEQSAQTLHAQSTSAADPIAPSPSPARSAEATKAAEARWEPPVWDQASLEAVRRGSQDSGAPVREIGLRLPAIQENGGDASVAVDIHLRQRAGQLNVSVRTADTGLATDLREGLSDLVRNLQHRGFEAVTHDAIGRDRVDGERTPGVHHTDAQNQAETSSNDPGGRRSGSDQQSSSHRQNQQRRGGPFLDFHLDDRSELEEGDKQ